MLANKQCIMIEGHWFNNSKIFSLLKNLEDTKLRIFFHNPDFNKCTFHVFARVVRYGLMVKFRYKNSYISLGWSSIDI